MKRLLCAIFLSLLISYPHFVQSQDKPAITLHDVTWIDGTRQTFSITEQSAMRIPEYHPERDEKTPLSIYEAVRLAKEWAKKQNQKDSKADIANIMIRRIKWPELMNRWFYIIELTKYEHGYKTDGPPVTAMTRNPTVVVLLMDGTIVKPVISKSASQR